MTTTTNGSPILRPLREWRDRRFLVWAGAGAVLALALTAPVRPWGWAGTGLLPSAGIIGFVALRGTRGGPPRQLWWRTVLAGLILAAAFRVATRGGPFLR